MHVFYPIIIHRYVNSIRLYHFNLFSFRQHHSCVPLCRVSLFLFFLFFFFSFVLLFLLLSFIFATHARAPSNTVWFGTQWQLFVTRIVYCKSVWNTTSGGLAGLNGFGNGCGLTNANLVPDAVKIVERCMRWIDDDYMVLCFVKHNSLHRDSSAIMAVVNFDIIGIFTHTEQDTYCTASVATAPHRLGIARDEWKPTTTTTNIETNQNCVEFVRARARVQFWRHNAITHHVRAFLHAISIYFFPRCLIVLWFVRLFAFRHTRIAMWAFDCCWCRWTRWWAWDCTGGGRQAGWQAGRHSMSWFIIYLLQFYCVAQMRWHAMKFGMRAQHKRVWGMRS